MNCAVFDNKGSVCFYAKQLLGVDWIFTSAEGCICLWSLENLKMIDTKYLCIWTLHTLLGDGLGRRKHASKMKWGYGKSGCDSIFLPCRRTLSWIKYIEVFFIFIFLQKVLLNPGWINSRLCNCGQKKIWISPRTTVTFNVSRASFLVGTQRRFPRCLTPV